MYSPWDVTPLSDLRVRHRPLTCRESSWRPPPITTPAEADPRRSPTALRRENTTPTATTRSGTASRPCSPSVTDRAQRLDQAEIDSRRRAPWKITATASNASIEPGRGRQRPPPVRHEATGIRIAAPHKSERRPAPSVSDRIMDPGTPRARGSCTRHPRSRWPPARPTASRDQFACPPHLKRLLTPADTDQDARHRSLPAQTAKQSCGFAAARQPPSWRVIGERQERRWKNAGLGRRGG